MTRFFQEQLREHCQHLLTREALLQRQIKHPCTFVIIVSTFLFKGTLASDGTKFDCSKDRGKPLTFMIGIGQVIKGWDEGIMSMHLGEISKLEISSAFAYGEAGSGGKEAKPSVCLHPLLLLDSAVRARLKISATSTEIHNVY